MRFDLDGDVTVDRAYAKINLEQGAERARNSLLHPSARLDKLAAFHEAQRFLDSVGVVAPGHWITAEVLAHSLAGIRVTAEEAARGIVADHNEWQRKAAEIAMTVRAAELRLKAATTPREIHQIISRVVWPATEGDLP
jgi:hypothetical protein